MIFLLSGVAIVFFLIVTALSNLYGSQQDRLSERWASRGRSDLKSAHFQEAVDDFHSALRYSRDDYAQQLGLAEALIGLKHIDEASSYLKALWEQQPENGVVNRELARIAAGKGEVSQALRYYHNAVYATWPANADKERRDTRWELIKYLLSRNAKPQAQSELISLSADIGDSPSQQIDLGDYFLQVQDPGHALKAYRSCLSDNQTDAEALSGAGTAAFEMGDYRLAERYLKRAIAQNPGDQEAHKLLQVTELVFDLDPFRYDSSDSDRDHLVTEDFQTAGERLQHCPAIAQISLPSNARTSLMEGWLQLNPMVTNSHRRRTSAFTQQVFQLISQIERQAVQKCGPGIPADQALVLISRMHEGN